MCVGVDARRDQFVVLEIRRTAIEREEVERDVRSFREDPLRQHLAHAGGDGESADDAADSWHLSPQRVTVHANLNA